MTKICYARTARRTRVDPETGEVLDSASIPETQEGELLL